jgi:hypothetical protein
MVRVSSSTYTIEKQLSSDGLFPTGQFSMVCTINYQKSLIFKENVTPHPLLDRLSHRKSLIFKENLTPHPLSDRWYLLVVAFKIIDHSHRLTQSFLRTLFSFIRT